MAEAVASAIAGRFHLLAEAGTGVGKSFAYLVPAIQAACASKDPECRIVISTHTISLQEQLIRKDIPFLQSVMPEKFAALLVKGRGNYLSKRRLRVAQQRGGFLLGEFSAQDQLQQIGAWAKETTDGSRSDLDFRPLAPVWDLVGSDSSNCLGKRCADFGECFYFNARRNMQSAKILVVNHALFFTDLALRSLKRDVGILPKYQVVIFDEAHTLEDVAAEHLGLSISRGQAEYLLHRLMHERKGKLVGLLALHGDDEAKMQLGRTRSAVQQFFDALLDWRVQYDLRQKRAGTGDSVRIRQPGIVPNALSPALLQLSQRLDSIADGITNPEEQVEVESAASRCEDLASRIDAWIGQKLDDQVYWMEGTGARGDKLELASAPIEIGKLLREKVFDRIPSVVLASATLHVGGKNGFGFFKERLGFPDDPMLQLGSPFDYRTQAELHLFRRMPDPTTAARDFEEACWAKIEEYVQRTQGRAFVLFTSNQTMQRAATQLRERLHARGLPLLCQGDGMPANRMVEAFRATAGAVLFGVDSFWQGVDVQGEALSNVIITKLPFTPPDRPLTEARGEAIAARGGHAFMDLSLPQAILKLKQGFGRLIRTRTDRGLVAILDPRMLTKPYGRQFLDALPNCKRFIDGVETRTT